jgi:hypothetical protein
MKDAKEMIRFTLGDAITAGVKGALYYLDAGRVDDIIREAVTRAHEQFIEEKRRDSYMDDLTARTGMTADQRGYIG